MGHAFPFYEHFMLRRPAGCCFGDRVSQEAQMLFVWMGFLKSADPIDQGVQEQITDFLQQPYMPITSAGPLHNANGERTGYLMIFEAEHREAAEALVGTSPIRQAGLYREFHLLEYQNWV
jgi:uncharacterized protein YciI